MILKGSQRGGGTQLARHLMNLHDNDHVELHELRGFVASELAGALKEAHAVSLGTKCSQFLFSLSLNPPELENVPVAVFEEAINTIEKKLSLVSQPRAIVFHEKAGRRHAHCVWFRIHAERMRAINLPHFKMKLQDVSRQLYLENNWSMPRGLQKKSDSDPLNFTLGQSQQAKRVKLDARTLKSMFQKCWAVSDSRAAFAGALKERGFILAKGNRRGFVAVDKQGEVYSISRWVGVKTKEVRARLRNDKGLPNVDEALGLLTARLTDEVQESCRQTDQQYNTRLKNIESERLLLASQHRIDRSELRQAQQERWNEGLKARTSHLPTGLKASWFKLSGKYQKILDENQASIHQAEKRDWAERQQLIQRQLKERRQLQQKVRQLRFQHEVSVKTNWQETGDCLHHLDLSNTAHQPFIDPAQPLILPVDEEALSIAAKVRRTPETILDVISDKKETFTRNDILRALANYIEEPMALRLASETVFQSKELVELEAIPSPRYTTREMQRLKKTLAENVQVMAETANNHVHSKYKTAAIEKQNKVLQRIAGANLSAEQETVINHVLNSEQLSAVVGFAGAGKSTLLAAAREAWERQGYCVLGAALSGKAADGLESTSGIESRTLASLEYSWKHGYSDLQKGDVLVIDEAGMIGTRQLARFVEKAQQCGAKLVLVGDPEQLQPIQAGTPFKDICEQIKTAQLTEIRRQTEEWQCKASRDLAEKRTHDALKAYEEHGFVKCTNDTSSAITALVEDYLSDIEQHGKEASRVALTHRRKDVHLINQTIRFALKSTGALEDEILFQTTHGGRAFASGDRILFTRNDKELDVRNGSLGTVETVGNNKITVRLDSGDGSTPRCVTITPTQYNAFDHGYATTIHKSQGATVDRSFVLGSHTMDRHLTYVALTRHRDDMNLYLDQKAMQKISQVKVDSMVLGRPKWAAPRRY